MLNNEKKVLTVEQIVAAALGLLVTTSGSLFMLQLLVRTANASVVRRAAVELSEGLRIRITPLVARHRSTSGLKAPSLATCVERAAEAVEKALPTCRSRSPKDFAAWIERCVRSHLDGEPATPVALTTLRAHADAAGADSFGLVAAPRAERTAVLQAVLRRLPAADREVLQARMRPRASWPQVAAALGVSENTARTRYAMAVERAQLLVVDVLSEQRRIDEQGGREFDQAA